MTKHILKTSLIHAMVIVFISMSFQMPTMASMIGNQELASQSELQIQRNEVRSFMAREDVRAAMKDYGVAEADLDKRIDNMTERELIQIQNQMAMLPAGEGALGVVLTILVIFILLDVLGVTNVFSRV